MTRDQINTATLDQLTDELAAAGWDSTQTELTAARAAVTALFDEIDEVTETFNFRDEQSHQWTYTVMADGRWRRPEGGWKLPQQAAEMGAMFASRHAEAVARLSDDESV